MAFKIGPRITIRMVLGIALAYALTPAQLLSQAQKDSGWVAVFDGTTLNGFYSSLNGKAPDTNIAKTPDGTFAAQNGTIHATGNPTGHIATKKKYSHYRVRVRIRFDKLGDMGQNAGMLYHVQESAPKLFGAYPRSIEYQGQKRGIGEVWTIGNVYINTTIDPAVNYRKYKEGGTMVTHGNPNDRQCQGSSAPWDDAGWNLMEAYVRGSDSAIHTVNGKVVFKLWKLRWSATDKPDDMSTMLKEGPIALQSEGAPVAYKDYMIMELDPVTGKPINAKPTGVQSVLASAKNLVGTKISYGGNFGSPRIVRNSADLTAWILDGRRIRTQVGVLRE